MDQDIVLKASLNKQMPKTDIKAAQLKKRKQKDINNLIYISDLHHPP